jgi:Spy/CpxP family protein refolding chaperone
MKSSIKFLAIVAFLFTMNFAANAQQRGGGQQPTPEQQAERETTQMVDQLKLDDAQAAKVKAT